MGSGTYGIHMESSSRMENFTLESLIFLKTCYACHNDQSVLSKIYRNEQELRVFRGEMEDL